jgi:hypothetical protein
VAAYAIGSVGVIELDDIGIGDGREIVQRDGNLVVLRQLREPVPRPINGGFPAVECHGGVRPAWKT